MWRIVKRTSLDVGMFKIRLDLLGNIVCEEKLPSAAAEASIYYLVYKNFQINSKDITWAMFDLFDVSFIQSRREKGNINFQIFALSPCSFFSFINIFNSKIQKSSIPTNYSNKNK